MSILRSSELEGEKDWYFVFVHTTCVTDSCSKFFVDLNIIKRMRKEKGVSLTGKSNSRPYLSVSYLTVVNWVSVTVDFVILLLMLLKLSIWIVIQNVENQLPPSLRFTSHLRFYLLTVEEILFNLDILKILSFRIPWTILSTNINGILVRILVEILTLKSLKRRLSWVMEKYQGFLIHNEKMKNQERFLGFTIPGSSVSESLIKNGQ